MCQLKRAIGELGPIVDAIVCITETREAALRNEGRTIPEPIGNLRALIDTGSDSVALDTNYAVKLSLPFHSIGRMHTVHDIKYPAQFEIGIRIPLEEEVLFYAEIPGSCFSKLKECTGVDMIIGRDVLRTLRLLYDGPSNTFTLSYERPSE